MKLKVPFYKQPVKSVLCGPTCLRMIYAYYGIKKPLKQIAKELSVSKTGTYIADLGVHLMKNGFDVSISGRSTTCFIKSDEKLNKSKLVKVLRKRLINKKQKSKRNIRKVINFIEKGGDFKVRIATSEDIIKQIKAKNPSIICIDYKALYGDKTGLIGHFVIGSGFTEDSFIINDPFCRYEGGIREYPMKELIFGLYSRGGYIMFIKPKK